MTGQSEDLIEHHSERLLRTSGYSGDGFAAGYDSHRPSPPQALLDVLCLEAQIERPRLVVDLGSGTGLSTRAWADRADEVVGIEASPEMRAQAEAARMAENVRFVQAYAEETGLPDGVADVVACSQSFHWMEPEPTLAEAARILRPGGVFAAYDYDWPPVVHWEVEAAFEEMIQRLGLRRALRGLRKDMHARAGPKPRIVGMALSLGPMTVMQEGGARSGGGTIWPPCATLSARSRCSSATASGSAFASRRSGSSTSRRARSPGR